MKEIKEDMEIKINIEKRHLALFALFVIVLAGALVVNAFGGTQPNVMGHSPGEIDWSQPIESTVNNNLKIKNKDDMQQIVLGFSNIGGNKIQLDVGGTGHSTDSILLGDAVNPDNNVVTKGSVGIGTLTPTAKLDVVGGIKVGNPGIIFSDTSVQTTAYNRYCVYFETRDADNGVSYNIDLMVNGKNICQSRGGCDVTLWSVDNVGNFPRDVIVGGFYWQNDEGYWIFDADESTEQSGKNGDTASEIMISDLQDAGCRLLDDSATEALDSKIVLRDSDGDERCFLSVCERKG